MSLITRIVDAKKVKEPVDKQMGFLVPQSTSDRFNALSAEIGVGKRETLELAIEALEEFITQNPLN